MPAFRDLVDRRVPQYLAVYLGAGWAIVEFIGFLEQRYALPALWTDLTLLVWVLFIPSVILFSYHHGQRGKDRWVRTEKIGIPLNAGVVAVVVAVALSSRADASVTTVVLTDETGETVERAVPRSESRKRLAIFSFDAPASDTALGWLANGAPTLLATDLSQDIFLDMRVTAHFRERLQEAGIEPDQAVPVALQRRIAGDLHLPYFLSGSVTRDDSATQRLAALAEFQPPIYVVGERMSSLGMLVEAGQHARALATLDELREQMQAQFVDFWRVGQLGIAIQTRDTLQLNEAIAGVRPIIDGLGLRILEPAVAHGVAVLNEVRGDWDGALDAYQRQRQLDPGSLAINRDIARALRQLGRLDDALAALDEHLRAVPMSAKSNLEAARVLLERGDTARARDHFERASRTLSDADASYPLLDDLKSLQPLARTAASSTF